MATLLCGERKVVTRRGYGSCALLVAFSSSSSPCRAATRWVGRYCVERPRVELAEAQLLLSLLAALPQQPKVAARGLEALFAERGEAKLAEVVRRWQVEAQRTR